MPGTSRSGQFGKTSRRAKRAGGELQFDHGAFSEIYFIDIVYWPPSRPEPEILSRIIRHATNPEDVKEEGSKMLKGVSFVGAEAVRILNSDGVEIFCSRLAPADHIDA